MVISYEAIMLGLELDSRQLTVGIPQAYMDEVRGIIDTHWHHSRKSFTVHEIELLAGNLGRLGKGAPWLYHMMNHIYSSVAKALRQHGQFLHSTSHEFRRLVQLTKTARKDSVEADVSEIKIAIRLAAQKQHHCKQQYFISKSLQEEVNLIHAALMPDSGVSWVTPIAHMIPRIPSFAACGDACLYGGGGFSVDMKF